MGTAFLTCDEAGVPEAYKQAILAAREDQTRVTRAFSGRPARGIVNRFMTEVEDGSPDSILPFPLQNQLTRPLRTTAAKQGRAEFLSLWAGQGVRLARRQPACPTDCAAQRRNGDGHEDSTSPDRESRMSYLGTSPYRRDRLLETGPEPSGRTGDLWLPRQAKAIIAVEKKTEGRHLRSHCFEIQYVVIRS
jgi:hypothetical protein